MFLASAYLHIPDGLLSLFISLVAWLLAVVAGLRARASARHAPDERGVTLASFHAAKGLEWDAVFLAGLSEASLLIAEGQIDAAIARHAECGEALQRGLVELGFELFAVEGHRLPELTTVRVPDRWPAAPVSPPLSR